jgi:splicing factor 3B subunit 3
MMHLYHLTLQKPGSINCAALGNFSGTKSQELVVSRGGRMLELIRPDTSTGKLQSVASMELFCVIRALSSFRLTGGQKDYVVVGGDSGRLVILEFLADIRKFAKIHEETFGKSGCRRMIPGQYVTIDPKGRAILVGAIEKQRFVYVMNRDANARLTISSPLEAHKSKTFIYDCIGLDVGFENPLFACLEMDYSELEDLDESMMTAYSLNQQGSSATIP